MSRRKSNKGFTLIELMIIVSIVGILAAIAIPQVALLMDKSRVKRGLPPRYPEIYYANKHQNSESKYQVAHSDTQAGQSAQGKLNCVCTPQ